MKILKHLLKVAKAKSKSISCKHLSSQSASCPFTGLTYTYCTVCMKKIDTRKTDV